MTKETITLPLDTLQDLMIGYVRYCLPRHSYIVPKCVEHVKTYWDKLNENYKAMIKNEVRSQVDTYENLMAR